MEGCPSSTTPTSRSSPTRCCETVRCATGWCATGGPIPSASSTGRPSSIATKCWPTASWLGSGPLPPSRRADRPAVRMSAVGRHPLLSAVAARARRALGMDELTRRLDGIESGLDALQSARWPNGPLYFGDHTALVATRWGAKMLVDTCDAAISPWIVLDGLWETHVTQWLQEALSPGQVFVDV